MEKLDAEVASRRKSKEAHIEQDPASSDPAASLRALCSGSQGEDFLLALKATRGLAESRRKVVSACRRSGRPLSAASLPENTRELLKIAVPDRIQPPLTITESEVRFEGALSGSSPEYWLSWDALRVLLSLQKQVSEFYGEVKNAPDDYEKARARYMRLRQERDGDIFGHRRFAKTAEVSRAFNANVADALIGFSPTADSSSTSSDEEKMTRCASAFVEAAARKKKQSAAPKNHASATSTSSRPATPTSRTRKSEVYTGMASLGRSLTSDAPDVTPQTKFEASDEVYLVDDDTGNQKARRKFSKKRSFSKDKHRPTTLGRQIEKKPSFKTSGSKGKLEESRRMSAKRSSSKRSMSPSSRSPSRTSRRSPTSDETWASLLADGNEDEGTDAVEISSDQAEEQCDTHAAMGEERGVEASRSSSPKSHARRRSAQRRSTGAATGGPRKSGSSHRRKSKSKFSSEELEA
eukprot:gnl/TRDRNA2_/TRDRNA2_163758_c0_seq2.p1 gnl/TRDRNA2_/TRDRNA2_163758_c0~~gnl/TRDRNA2_/TRDRNA2_163758_c0_seq2.p1  ORF type:complete len:465 (-),score=82.90 gnl/TRDRNA2_/TRDRNA2_163758_c0_seq2:100-1494(-)